MAKKEYRLREDIPKRIDEELTSYPATTRKLLYYRGIRSREEAEQFLNPDYNTHLHDPYLMRDMERAVGRILQAVEDKEKILIYSDYDADGIPGAVVLREFFEKIGHANVENYIPDRHDEGYGLHLEAVENFGGEGVNLLITVDCGTVDFEQIARAKALGIDVIVTDHHEANGFLPEAHAILNPKQENCPYPEKILCGSGVVFKLIQAILSRNRFNLKDGQEKWFLDLVGIATLSDMVPLTGENRALAHYGLKVLQKSPRPGLQKLWRKLNLDPKNLSEDDVGFTLSPRINAASRMGHPMDAFRLLSTKDETEADQLSDYLNRLNDERKGVVASIVKEIKKHIRELSSLPNVLVLGNPSWKPALLGLAANSLLDDFSRPIFLWGRNGERELKGSCRSDGSVNLVALMEKVKDTFIQFGGHKLAGGFEVSHEKIHRLEEELNRAYEEVKSSPESAEADSGQWIDSRLSLSGVNWDTYREIEKLAPFGVGNPKPVFLFENVSPKTVRQFGKEGNHMELVFENGSEKNIRAISFFSKPKSFEKKPQVGMPVDLIASFEKSNFRNYPELRLRIVDIV
ncbi:single-stranded-DNA-specific exonuclease RecJ [Patescibacteria group bacterium]|nr:MAG: single-stranded-DNA-specific exonuclease RecJ [Patescibacteria group bacterium]